MSQAPDRATRISIPNPDRPDPPPRTKAKVSFEDRDILSGAASNSTDESYMLYSMYNERATKMDKTWTDDLAKDAESIMLLGGLIAATVSTFLSQVYSIHSSDSSDLTAQYHISHSTLLSAIAMFFWFMCLASSLASAVIATLVQGWVRRYMAMTQLQLSSDNSARIRAYVLRQEPLDKFQFTVESMRLLSEFSISSFIVGLCVLTASNADYYSLTAIVIGAFPLLIAYAWVTLDSILYSHSVLSTPFSKILGTTLRWFKRLLSALWDMVRRCQVHDPNHVISHNWWVLDEIKSRSLSLDREIVKTILRFLNQGHDLERFLASIPSFYRSVHVQEPEQVFRPFCNILSKGIVSFIDHTLSSQTLPNETKQDRIKISLQVMDVDPYLLQRTFFYALTHATKPIIFQCADLVLVADRSADSEDQTTQLLAKCIIAVAISHLKDHQPDPRLSHVVERWLNSATFANTYRGRRASMKMINLVRLARVLNSAGESNWDEIFGKALLAVAEFDEVESAADEYKVEFCVLWNQLLDAASADGKSNAIHILPHIHNVHTALHGGTATNDSAYYTRCPFLIHHPTPRATSQPNFNGSGSRKVEGKNSKAERRGKERGRGSTAKESHNAPSRHARK